MGLHLRPRTFKVKSPPFYKKELAVALVAHVLTPSIGKALRYKVSPWVWIEKQQRAKLKSIWPGELTDAQETVRQTSPLANVDANYHRHVMMHENKLKIQNIIIFPVFYDSSKRSALVLSCVHALTKCQNACILLPLQNQWEMGFPKVELSRSRNRVTSCLVAIVRLCAWQSSHTNTLKPCPARSDQVVSASFLFS